MIPEFLFGEKIFNIHSIPKTTEQLKNLKKHWAKITLCLCGGSFLIVLLIRVLAQYIRFNFTLTLDDLFEYWEQGLILLDLSLVFLVFISIRQFINDWKDFLVSLQPIDPEDAPHIVKLCKTDSIVAAYQNKVVAQKRSLLKGEKKAMCEWVYLEKKTPEDKAKTKADKTAYKKLLKPLTPNGENQ